MEIKKKKINHKPVKHARRRIIVIVIIRILIPHTICALYTVCTVYLRLLAIYPSPIYYIRVPPRNGNPRETHATVVMIVGDDVIIGFNDFIRRPENQLKRVNLHVCRELRAVNTAAARSTATINSTIIDS